MSITYHREVEQGSDAWYALRRGTLCASEVSKIMTPTLKVADNEKTRAHVYELLAQRITGYTEPQYVSDAMLRGHVDEITARGLYAEHYAPVEEVGFVTNDQWGFTIGYSPDGLVGEEGLIECKSRGQKFQIATIIDQVADPDYLLQVQTGLLVTGRKWLDYLSFCGGLPMATIRVYPDEKIHAAIVEAATSFEGKIAEKLVAYNARLASDARLIPTERTVEVEMYIGEGE